MSLIWMKLRPCTFQSYVMLISIFVQGIMIGSFDTKNEEN